MVGVNEYYTSKKCPICKNFVGQVDIRRLYCSECKTFMHRDVMAGHNICNVIQGHLFNQERPRYLQPRDANNFFPWSESKNDAVITGSKVTDPVPVVNPAPVATNSGVHPEGSRRRGIKRKAPMGMEESQSGLIRVKRE